MAIQAAYRDPGSGQMLGKGAPRGGANARQQRAKTWRGKMKRHLLKTIPALCVAVLLTSSLAFAMGGGMGGSGGMGSGSSMGSFSGNGMMNSSGRVNDSSSMMNSSSGMGGSNYMSPPGVMMNAPSAPAAPNQTLNGPDYRR